MELGLIAKNETFFIAEAGINHGGSLKKAIKLIDKASEAGADAVKFQTYISELRAPKGNSEILEILKKCELPFEDFSTLKSYADSKNIQFFSTPFDNESASFLSKLDCNIAKIASFDSSNNILLNHSSKLFKTLILSVGMTTIEEIDNFVEVLKSNNCNPVILHCVSSYPMNYSDARLVNINYLSSKYPFLIGYSDHSTGIQVPLYAIAAGAKVIEKHFMLEDDDCIDKPVSIDVNLFKKLIEESKILNSILGELSFGIRESEQQTKIFKRKS